jgi:hypothetical protein
VTASAAATHEATLDALRKAVGAEHVLATSEEREAHATDTSHWHQVPGFVVYPAAPTRSPP